MRPEAFFMAVEDGTVGQRFCLYYGPEGDHVRGLVLYVHPFAEEMNKSRRMAALQAREFSKAGYGVLQIDLLGCGDSSGDFGDATWQSWIDDVLLACRWLRARSQAPLWLWGLRAGCLIAAQAARQLNNPCHLLLWQPTLSGKQVLQQFLRLKAAGEMLSGQPKGAMESMRSRLIAGHPVEVAGYRISPELAAGLEQAHLQPAEQIRRVEWIDITTHSDAELSPASANIISAWRNTGCALHHQLVKDSTFWQSSEIEEATKLLDATLAALRETANA